jgi:hypothetical protein
MVMSLQSVNAFRQFGLESFAGGTTGKAIALGSARADLADPRGPCRRRRRARHVKSPSRSTLESMTVSASVPGAAAIIAAMIVTPILTLLFFVSAWAAPRRRHHHASTKASGSQPARHRADRTCCGASSGDLLHGFMVATVAVIRAIRDRRCRGVGIGTAPS